MDEDEALAAAIAASMADFESSQKQSNSKTRPTALPPKRQKVKSVESAEQSDDEYDSPVDMASDEVGSDEDYGYDDDGMDVDEDVVSDDDAMEFALADEEPVATKAYECMSRDEIITQQTKAINKISDVLSLPFSTARILLQFCMWDSEKLLTAWSEDSAKLAKKAGIDMNADEKKATAVRISGECSICMDDSDDIMKLSCGDACCLACWKTYLDVKIKEKEQRIRCIGKGCDKILDEYTVMQLAGSKDLTQRFNEMLVGSYVEYNQMVQWCPAPNCKYAVHLREVQAEHNESITCKCGHYFCFRCQEKGHAPALCDMAKEWGVKNAGGDEALNQKFLSVVSRPCPACKTSIEKNGGCNHMTCYKCQYHFCWQCMGKFGSGERGSADGYSSHKCNNYFKEDDKLSLDREDWERFRWYSERYNNHQRSSNIEDNILKEADATRSMMQDETTITWAATSFYIDALKQLIANRASMMNSYVFGFFRPLRRPEINKQLFEHRQNELERHTEQLAKWFDNKLEPEDNARELVANRLRIINDTKLCTASNKALLDVAANALEPEKRPSYGGGLRTSREGSKVGRKTKHGPLLQQPAQGRGPNFWDQTPAAPERTREELDAAAEARAEALRAEQQREVARREHEEARRREKEELDRVLNESMKNVQTDEDELLQRALALSKAESKAAASRPRAQEDLDMEEAIRLSLMDN